jgi:hypothetical protein
MSNAAIAGSARVPSSTLIRLGAAAPDPAPHVIAFLAETHGCVAFLRRTEVRPAGMTASPVLIEIEALGLDVEQAMGLTRELRRLDRVIEVRVRWSHRGFPAAASQT